SRYRRCSVLSDRSVQAKSLLGRELWGTGLGDSCGWIENPSYHVEATKKAICWPFQSPLTDSNRRPPPYHGGFALLVLRISERTGRALSLQFGLFLRLLLPFA